MDRVGVNKMTELEKMLNEEYYFATDKELSSRRLQAKKQCFEINQTCPSLVKQKKKLIKALLPNVKSAWIEQGFHCDYGNNIYSEHGLFLNHNVTILDGTMVSFGKSVLVGPNTVIASTSHHMDPEERQRGICRSKKIVIGDGVWIGANVTILGGVEIGNNAVIAAGVVVSQSVINNAVLKVSN